MGWKLGVMGRGKNCKDVDIQMWMRFLDENCLEVIGIGKRIENIRVGGVMMESWRESRDVSMERRGKVSNLKGPRRWGQRHILGDLGCWVGKEWGDAGMAGFWRWGISKRTEEGFGWLGKGG